MGCASSTPATTQPAKGRPVAGPSIMSAAAAATAPPAMKGKGKGKGKSAGKAKGKGKGKGRVASKFQIELKGEWQDYGAEEDGILKRAFLVGHPNAKYNLRAHDYEYNFRTMKQRNLDTGKLRNIRPPYGMTAPKTPLLPPGAMVVITVPDGMAGQTMTISDPNNPGQQIQVAVPAGARKGAKMAVPVPKKGETIADVKKKQDGYSTGAKVAMGGAAVGALAVGGVVLGDHLSGGAISEAVPELAAAEDWVAGAAEDAGAWLEGAAEDVGAWAEGAADDAGVWAEGAVDDAGEWIAGAAEDAGAWTEGAAEDVAEWTVAAAEDVGDWFGDAVEDTGHFIMDLF